MCWKGKTDSASDRPARASRPMLMFGELPLSYFVWLEGGCVGRVLVGVRLEPELGLERSEEGAHVVELGHVPRLDVEERREACDPLLVRRATESVVLALNSVTLRLREPLDLQNPRRLVGQVELEATVHLTQVIHEVEAAIELEDMLSALFQPLIRASEHY